MMKIKLSNKINKSVNKQKIEESKFKNKLQIQNLLNKFNKISCK